MTLSYRLLLVAGLAVAGCSHPAPVTRVAPETTVAASTGKTWDAVIDFATEHQLTIKSTDRASGLLQTDVMALPGRASEWSSVADCGSTLGVPMPPHFFSSTFVVRGDSTQSVVRVRMAFLDSRGKACATRETYEPTWEADIKARAERR